MTTLALITTNDINQLNLSPLTPAVTTGTLGANPLLQIIWNVIFVLFIVAIYGFLLAMLIGAVQYLFSAGSEEAITKSKKTFTNATIGLVVTFFSYSVLNFVIGQFGPVLQQGSFSVATLVGRVFQIVTALSGGGFLLMLLFGGFLYLTSAGNDEGATKAKKQITSAIIGILLVALAFGIGTTILSILGIK